MSLYDDMQKVKNGSMTMEEYQAKRTEQRRLNEKKSELFKSPVKKIEEVIAAHKQTEEKKQTFNSLGDYTVVPEGKEFDSLDAEIKNLEGILGTAEEYERKIQSYQNKSNTWQKRSGAFKTDGGFGELEKKTQREYNTFLKNSGFSSSEDIRRAIAQKRGGLSQQKHYAKGYTLSDVGNPQSAGFDKEFSVKSRYYPAEQRAKMLIYTKDGSAPKPLDVYNDVYEYINSNTDVKNKFDESFKIYDYMTDNEKAIYNYYQNLYGKSKADEYFNTIQDFVSTRMAKDEFKDYEGKTFKEIGQGFSNMGDRFKRKMQYLVNTEDDYIPLEPYEVLSSYIREDLPVLGRVAYDLASTTADMLPSIGAAILSNAIVPGSGAYVGAGLMGLSSAGGSYREKLNAGWDKGQARVYSTLIGASEAGLSAAFSGIGKLGGKLSGKTIKSIAEGIDNAAARFAFTYGGKMVSEFSEEAAQEVLSPFFENLALGYQENSITDIDLGQIAYSGMLGALSAGFLEAVPSYQEAKKNGNKSNSTKTGKPSGKITFEDVLNYRPKTEQEVGMSDEIEYLTNTSRNNEIASVKEQIKNASDKLKKLSPVFNDTVVITNQGKTNNKNWVLNLLSKFGYKVNRTGIGEVIFDKKRVSKSLSYLKTEGELAAYSALPYVIRDGIIIHGHEDHKGRGYGTLTIAAPVVINGVTGNMGVVIRQDKNNLYYKVHRILMPDGTSFLYENKEGSIAERAGAAETTVTSPTDNTSFDISIPQTVQNSNNQFVENEKKGQTVTMSQESTVPTEQARVFDITPSDEGNMADQTDGFVPRGFGLNGVRQSAQWKAAVKLMDMLSRTMGTKFVAFDGDTWDEGHYDSKTRTAYINKNAERPFSWIVFHEFTHDLKVNDRAAFNTLVQWTRNDMNLENFNRYKGELLAVYDRIGAEALGFDYREFSQEEINDLVMEEVVCDMVAEILQDPQAIRRIAAQDLTLAEKIVNYLDEFIEKIVAALGYSDPEIRSLVNNFEETKRVYESVLENTAKKGSQSEGIDGPRKFIFGGKKAVHADVGTLSMAKKLRKQGLNWDQIYYTTGWHIGYDGKWRFEIDDSQMEVNLGKKHVEKILNTDDFLMDVTKRGIHIYQREFKELVAQNKEKLLTLGDILKHDKLFLNYPDLKDILVMCGERNSYISDANILFLDVMDEANLKSYLAHELQHAVQAREGFTPGSSSDMWEGTDEEKFEQYYYTAGEVEARNVSDRLYLDETQRRRIMPIDRRIGVGFAEDAPGYKKGISLANSEKPTDNLQVGLDNDKGDVVEYNEQDIINEALKQVNVRRVKMKQFPKGSGNEANAISARWAYRNGVENGSKNIVFYRNGCYVIEKYESADFKYLIVGKTKYQDYITVLNEVRENANAAKGQSTATMATDYGERIGPRNRVGGKRPGFDGDDVEHGREDRQVRQLDATENIRGNIASDPNRSNESGLEDRGQRLVSDGGGRGGIKYSVSRSEKPTDNLQDGLDNDKGDVVEYNEQDIINEALKQVNVRRVKMKQFPKGSGNEANAISARWAYRNGVENGSKNIVFYRNGCYVIEKYESADFKYLIVGKIKYQDYITVLNEVREREKNGERQSIQNRSDGLTDIDEERNRPGGKGRRASDVNAQYGEKNNGFQPMGTEQVDRWTFSSDPNRSNESGLEDRGQRLVSDGGGRGGIKYSVSRSEKPTDNLQDGLDNDKGDVVEYKQDYFTESGDINGYEQNSNSEELGLLRNSGEIERYHRMGEVGQAQSQKQNTPKTKNIHRSGVSAETITTSGLTAEQAAIKEQNKLEEMATEFYVKAIENGKEQSKVFLTENTVYYPDADFERNDISVKNGVASFTEKRFDELIEEYSIPVGGQTNRDYAKAYVAYISPSDFLRLTAIDEDLIVLDSAQYGNLDIKMLRNNNVQDGGPYLKIDLKTGRVHEHNGRHRMVLLRNAGINKVAIIVKDISNYQNKYKTTKHENVTLLGQRYDSGESAPGKVTIDEIIPLSPNYRNEVREKFVDVSTDIKYSVSRKARAEEAVAKYRETGDERELPARAWANSFARDTKNRSRYLANQMQGLTYELTFADEASRDAIENSISKLRDKIIAAAANEEAAAELKDLLDNVALKRNVDLASVISLRQRDGYAS